MSTRIFAVNPGAESRRFNAAFYKFIELRGWSYTDPHGHCSLKDTSFGRRKTKVVSLCSDAALSDFAEFWSRFRTIHANDLKIGSFARSEVLAARRSR